MGSIDGSPGSYPMKADETELRLEVERLRATVHVLRGRYEDSVDTADRRHKDRMKAEHNEQIALAEKEQWILRCLNAEAEVERLKTSLAIANHNNGSLTDEFNRAIALIREHCPKLDGSYSWLLEGIGLLVEGRDAALAEVERLRAHTWQAERAAVVEFILENRMHGWEWVKESIDRGVHGPEGEEP